jgi:hypothetical protein
MTSKYEHKREQAFNSFADAQKVRALARRDQVWTDGEEMQYQMLYAIGKLLEGISEQFKQLEAHRPWHPSA